MSYTSTHLLIESLQRFTQYLQRLRIVLTIARYTKDVFTGGETFAEITKYKQTV